MLVKASCRKVRVAALEDISKVANIRVAGTSFQRFTAKMALLRGLFHFSG